jgi:hypothetical protein
VGSAACQAKANEYVIDKVNPQQRCMLGEKISLLNRALRSTRNGRGRLRPEGLPTHVQSVQLLDRVFHRKVRVRCDPSPGKEAEIDLALPLQTGLDRRAVIIHEQHKVLGDAQAQEIQFPELAPKRFHLSRAIPFAKDGLQTHLDAQR